MALFNECMQSCAHIVLDTADIVRDGDLSTVIRHSLWIAVRDRVSLSTPLANPSRFAHFLHYARDRFV